MPEGGDDDDDDEPHYAAERPPANRPMAAMAPAAPTVAAGVVRQPDLPAVPVAAVMGRAMSPAAAPIVRPAVAPWQRRAGWWACGCARERVRRSRRRCPLAVLWGSRCVRNVYGGLGRRCSRRLDGSRCPWERVQRSRRRCSGRLDGSGCARRKLRHGQWRRRIGQRGADSRDTPLVPAMLPAAAPAAWDMAPALAGARSAAKPAATRVFRALGTWPAKTTAPAAVPDTVLARPAMVAMALRQTPAAE